MTTQVVLLGSRLATDSRFRAPTLGRRLGSSFALPVLVAVVAVLMALPAKAQFTYSNTNGTVTITGYTGTDATVVIPSTIDGLPVTSLGTSSFFGASLTSVTIPNSVKNIGDSAFSGCNRLGNITIPNSVTSIGDGPFSFCSSLTAITVDSANQNYSSIGGVLFDKGQTRLIQYPPAKAGPSYSIPDTVTSIGGQAFGSCSNLTSVTIPNSVTNIGDSTFENCSSLASATIPNGVTSIGKYAFYDCFSVTNVSIPNGLTSIGDLAFGNCSNLISVIIPNSVTSIGRGAFAKCTSLTSVTIPNSVTSLYGTFGGCTSLTSVTIPNSVTSIGYVTFENCSSLTNVTIPNSVTSIGLSAFLECRQLRNVFFLGNAPLTEVPLAPQEEVFGYDRNAVIYYLPGTIGWTSNFGGAPTALWTLPYPLILNNNPAFGVQPNQFGFTVSWATNLSVVVEAATNLDNPVWSPLATNALSGGTVYFSDPQWTKYPRRFYRVRSQ
jgi:hypothetical protein